MYGLLLDTIQKFIREKYGESYWANIRRRAKLSNHWFVTHEVRKCTQCVYVRRVVNALALL